MRAWSVPVIPSIPGSSDAPRLHDTATDSIVEAKPADIARLYVCGITPYDATHLGHAATYLAFDTLQRVWRDGGYRVHYAQNVTDVDDPLLERAAATGVDWRELAVEQTDLFRADMESLGIIPPDDFVAVTDVIDDISTAVHTLREAALAYKVPTPDALDTPDGPGADLYFDIRAAERQVTPRGPSATRATSTGPPCSACSPNAGETPTGPASATSSTRCSGVPPVRANRPGNPRSAPGAPAGTSSVR
jgi:L-cysteine:1D-myo-inositol 2-amino-2-deoxy-alpha-D-glucopyranoside ligase